MGTSAITTVKDKDDNTLVVLYRQSDGYQYCHGKELKDFLDSKKLVNGIQEYTDDIANGMGCLAAQLISEVKTKVGLFYIYPEGVADEWVDFSYTVYPTDGSDDSTISITVMSYGEVIFDGLVKNYSPEDLEE